MSQIITSSTGNYNNTLAKNKLSKANDILTHTHNIDLSDYALKSELPTAQSINIEIENPIEENQTYRIVRADKNVNETYGWPRLTTKPGDDISYHKIQMDRHNRQDFKDKWYQIKEDTAIITSDNKKKYYVYLATYGAKMYTDLANNIHLSFFLFSYTHDSGYANYPFNFRLPNNNYFMEYTEFQFAGADGDWSYFNGFYTNGFSFKQYSDGLALNYINAIFYPYL